MFARSDGENFLVWAHNLGVGRNLMLSRELAAKCAHPGIPAVVHHHDWWFDNPEFSSCDRDVLFWSFEHGFNKPDPDAFRILTARLQVRGFHPAETLMVGDRPDNDIEPARVFGWQTWRLTPSKTNGQAGNWARLARVVEIA